MLRKAEKGDLPAVFRLFEQVKGELFRQGIDQWDDRYPTEEDLRGDIEAGSLWLKEVQGEIYGAVVLNSYCDEEYEQGAWRETSGNFRVIHRLCVAPAYGGRGVGRQLLEESEQLVKSWGVRSVRLDVFSQNPPALHLYEKAGYWSTGTADWRKGRFYLMDKIL